MQFASADHHAQQVRIKHCFKDFIWNIAKILEARTRASIQDAVGEVMSLDHIRPLRTVSDIQMLVSGTDVVGDGVAECVIDVGDYYLRVLRP
jgi:hypothetical protein